jgi:hypothetical protein
MGSPGPERALSGKSMSSRAEGLRSAPPVEVAGVTGQQLHGMRVVWQVATEGRYWHQSPGTLWTDLPSYISDQLEATFRRCNVAASSGPGDDPDPIARYKFRKDQYEADVLTCLQRNSLLETVRQLRRALVAQEGATSDALMREWIMRQREQEYTLLWSGPEPAATSPRNR